MNFLWQRFLSLFLTSLSPWSALSPCHPRHWTWWLLCLAFFTYSFGVEKVSSPRCESCYVLGKTVCSTIPSPSQWCGKPRSPVFSRSLCRLECCWEWLRALLISVLLLLFSFTYLPLSPGTSHSPFSKPYRTLLLGFSCQLDTAQS